MPLNNARWCAVSITLLLSFSPSFSNESAPATDVDSSYAVGVEDFTTAVPLEDTGLRNLWQALSTPERGDILRIRDRNPIQELTSERYHYLHLERNNIELLLLESYDIGRPTWRRIHSTLGFTSPSTTLLLGHFRANLGEGWTVQSSPSFALASSPLAPFYHSAEGFTPNSSTEALRGWFGGAIHLVPWVNSWAPSIDLWAGGLEYEGGIPYRGRGYSLYTEIERNRPGYIGIGEFQSGIAVNQAFNNNRDRIQLIRSQSQFSRLLTPMTTARYRFTEAGQNYGATGLTYSHTGNRLLLRGELTHQDHGADGGSAAAAYQTDHSGTFTSYIYRATNHFATLHARPYLPFGEDPAGKAGTQVGWIGKGLGFRTIAVNVAQDRAETETVNSAYYDQARDEIRTWNNRYDDEKAGAWLTLERTLGRGFELSLRGATSLETTSQLYLDSTTTIGIRELGTGRQSVRATLTHRNRERTIHLRYQYVFAYNRGSENSDDDALTSNGRLIGAQWQSHLGHGAELSFSGSYLLTDDWDSRVTVVETTAPGVYPFITESGRHMRLAARLDLVPFRGVVLWTSGFVDHDFAFNPNRPVGDYIPDNPRVGWGLGFDWRPTF